MNFGNAKISNLEKIKDNYTKNVDDNCQCSLLYVGL